MTDSGRFFLTLSPELTELIADSEIDLTAEIRTRLRDHDLDVQRDPSPCVVESGGSREKDPATIIFASGLTAAAVGWAVTQIINAVGHNKKLFVTERRVKPVVDSAGRLVKTKDGVPVVYATDEVRMIETALPPTKSSFVGSVGGDSFLRLELRDEGQK